MTGYSVAVGKFYGEAEGTYSAASAPKYNGKGCVIVYKVSSTKHIARPRILMGQKVSVYQVLGPSNPLYTPAMREKMAKFCGLSPKYFCENGTTVNLLRLVVIHCVSMYDPEKIIQNMLLLEQSCVIRLLLTIPWHV